MPFSEHDPFLRRTIELALGGVRDEKGGPFGAVIVKDGRVLAEGCNRVTSTNDPSAHAEIVAIRAACAALGHYELSGCTIYASCEPCPMCLTAIQWARLDRVVYTSTREDAAAAGFDDARFYRELEKSPEERDLPSEHLRLDGDSAPFDAWRAKEDRADY
jgi:tRNA(Arg) A34 adenosine deaminase TadA